jgi:hypothetical protein
MLFTEEELEKSGYNGTVFSCSFFIGWIENRHPCERKLGGTLFFNIETDRQAFVENVRHEKSYCGWQPDEGEYLGVKYGEYPVENGWINYDLGIRKSCHELLNPQH